MRLAGRLIVVTGASGGLGREIARKLALKEGADLVITGRRRHALEDLRGEIRGLCDRSVTVVPCDLSAEEGPRELHARAREAGRVFGLVNNAGVTHYGPAAEASQERLLEVLRTNLLAPVLLTRLFVRDFLDRGEGAILNVTSLAALITVPYQAAYTAAKQGLQAYSEALAGECRGAGVVITTFAPGGIATEMISSSGLDRRFGASSSLLMRADDAARAALRAWKRERLLAVPGIGNKLIALVPRLLPRRAVVRLAAAVYSPRPPRPRQT